MGVGVGVGVKFLISKAMRGIHSHPPSLNIRHIHGTAHILSSSNTLTHPLARSYSSQIAMDVRTYVRTCVCTYLYVRTYVMALLNTLLHIDCTQKLLGTVWGNTWAPIIMVYRRL
jgi:hypothetical protein